MLETVCTGPSVQVTKARGDSHSKGDHHSSRTGKTQVESACYIRITFCTGQAQVGAEHNKEAAVRDPGFNTREIQFTNRSCTIFDDALSDQGNCTGIPNFDCGRGDSTTWRWNKIFYTSKIYCGATYPRYLTRTFREKLYFCWQEVGRGP